MLFNMAMKYGLFFSLIFFQTLSFAKQTHEGKAEAGLFLSSTGQEEKVALLNGDISIDWYSKNCELSFDKLKVPCKLDVSQDLKNTRGELIMKDMPQVIVNSDQLIALYHGVAHDAKKNENLYQNVISEAGEAFRDGLSIPFYTCGDCSKNGKDLVLYNVFQSFVSKSHQISHSYLNNKKMVLKVTIKSMKANPGSFRVIGNNSQGNFSN